MIKVSILYPNRPGGSFDPDYYVNMHMPMAMKLLVSAVKCVSVELGVSGAVGGQAPPFHAITGFTCESLRAFSEAFLPVADELRGDMPNYTNIEPIIQVSKVSELRVSEPEHAASH